MLAADGRVIMISGANRGIGRAVADVLYDAGYNLSIAARDPDSLAPGTETWCADRFVSGRYDAQDTLDPPALGRSHRREIWPHRRVDQQGRHLRGRLGRGGR